MTAIVLFGMQAGDEGKGKVISGLASLRPVHTIVRYSGGAQASHNVIPASGMHHTFHQFGSGMFVPSVETFLSRWMLVEPIRMLNEAAELRHKDVRDPLGRTAVDERSLIITPFHGALNQLKERVRARTGSQHGSTGVGIGETRAFQIKYGDQALVAGDLRRGGQAAVKLRQIAELLIDEARHIDPSASLAPDVIDETLSYYDRWAESVRIVSPDYFQTSVASRPGDILFEGAQGVLLDEDWGFHPHTTWSSTTPANALAMLGETGIGRDETEVLGIMRTYATRHGAGPLPTEDSSLDANLPEPYNGDGEFTGAFRKGRLDLVTARYALDVAGPIDGLILTHYDAIEQGRIDTEVCVAYSVGAGRVDRLSVIGPDDRSAQERRTRSLFRSAPIYQRFSQDTFISEIEETLNAQVVRVSCGPASSELYRRETFIPYRERAA